MRYDVEPFTIPPARFHWRLYGTIPLGGESGGPGKVTLLEQCCIQNAAASPCDGFDSWETAKEDGNLRKRELIAQK